MATKNIDGRKIVVPEGQGFDTDDDIRHTAEMTKAAAAVILRALQDSGTHPMAAINALINVWHMMVMDLCPESYAPALAMMEEFHRQYLVANADA